MRRLVEFSYKYGFIRNYFDFHALILRVIACMRPLSIYFSGPIKIYASGGLMQRIDFVLKFI